VVFINNFRECSVRIFYSQFRWWDW